VVSYSRQGDGEPLVLLHGTNSSRHIWDPIIPVLARRRDVVAIDLPAHGESEASSLDPPGFAVDLAALFDELGLDAPAIVGHSVGGWTALELAKLRRAGAVLARAPAGLWSKHSPLMTDIGLQINWRLGQILGGLIDHSLKTRIGRSMGLRSVSARAWQIPYDTALAAAQRRGRLTTLPGALQGYADPPLHRRAHDPKLYARPRRLGRQRQSRAQAPLPAHRRTTGSRHL